MLYKLSELLKGQTAIVHGIGAIPEGLDMSQEEFEKRLLEMGFDEGTPVTILHEGPFNKDPIAVQIRNCYTVAIRRSEACAIEVAPCIPTESETVSVTILEKN